MVAPGGPSRRYRLLSCSHVCYPMLAVTGNVGFAAINYIRTARTFSFSEMVLDGQGWFDNWTVDWCRFPGNVVMDKLC